MGRENEMKWEGKMELSGKGKRDEVGRENEMKWKEKTR